MLIILKFLNIEKESYLMFKQIKKLITDNLQLKEKEIISLNAVQSRSNISIQLF